MRKTSIITLFMLFISMAVVAQQGIISGNIVDQSGLGMPGATIYMENLDRGTYSDVQGKFQLTGIPAGKHRLNISYIGYEPVVRELEVQGNQTTSLNIKLTSAYVQGKEVIVLGDRLLGQAKALNQQRTNTNITNIVSADQVGRFPDANIGDALKRIPGITVLNDQGEARFGLIRGTEPRFNSITVNGERLPSAESSTRTVQLDLIPSDMIQTIEVSKALTPDMDADAIGGSANLVTRAAPSDIRLSGTLGSGYNFLSEKPMGIASFILGKRFAQDKLGVIVSGSYMNHDFGSDNVEAEWDRTAQGVPFVTNLEIRKYDVQRIRRSLSASLDYRLGPNATLNFRSIYNLRDDFENRFRVIYSGMSAPNADGFTRGRVEAELKGGGEDQRLRRQERQQTTANTLSGVHLISGRIKLDWAATYAYAQEDRPNERYISFRSANLPLTAGLRPNTSNPSLPFVSTIDGFDIANQPFRRFQLRNDFTDERDLNGRFNLSIPLSAADEKSMLKIGGVIRNKVKDVQQRRGLLIPAQGQTVRFGDFVINDYTDNGYLANAEGVQYKVGNYPVPQSLQDFDGQYNATFENDDMGNQEASFDGSETVRGAYAMLTQQLGTRITAIAGLRLENTKVTYNATQFDQDDNASAVSGENEYTNVMPAVHIKYDFGSRTMLRAAWTNTLARPNYVDLAPSRNVDVSDNTLFSGNPSLKPTTSSNLDLMMEHYFPTVGIISAGVFHKNIRDFIYATAIQNYRDPITGNVFLRATTPQNGPSASLLGFELSFQRQLDFLPGFLKNLGLYLNYTYSDSDADVIFFNEDEETSEVIKTTLPGTSKHNFNGSLAYESKRFQARISVNYHSGFLDPDGTFLALATAGTADRRFLDSQLHVDANVTYTFSNRLRLFVEANNLTNQPLRFYQEVRERTMQSEYYNSRIQAGLKFDLFRTRE
jgi:TonB-dependent receptor